MVYASYTSALRTALIALCGLLVGGLAQSQDLNSLTRLGDGKSFRFSSCNPDWRSSNVDFKPIRPGETLTLADIKGPGVARRLWMTILPSEAGYSRLMSLRIYWDGEVEPSVQCPIGDFFGVGHGLDADVKSLPVRVSADGRARCCFWAMPFHKSARITVTNDGSQATWCFYFQVDGDYEAVPQSAPTFHAMYRQEFPCSAGNYVVADILGRGHYVGTVLSVRSTSEGWFGEGNDYFYIDGAKEPTLRGTGMEDYFGEAWGLRISDGAYSGCSVFEGGYPGARASAFRWHVADPVRFESGLRVEFQHQGVGPAGPNGEFKNNVERPDEFSSVGFWYQIGPHRPYPPLPSGYDRLPFDYRRFVEAESLKFDPPASGKAESVKSNGLHGDAELEWTGAQVGDELTLPFSASSADTYQLMVLVSRRPDGGLGRFYVDGKPVSDPVSFYQGDFTPLCEISLQMGRLGAGAHTLSLRRIGKPADADDGAWFSIDGYVLQPLRKATK